jgi:hypothetical protein
MNETPAVAPIVPCGAASGGSRAGFRPAPPGACARVRLSFEQREQLLDN